MLDGEIIIKSQIDLEFLNEAEKEIYEILLKQHLSFSDRWYSNKFLRGTSSVVRLFGLVVSLSSFAFCVYVIVMTPSWCPAWESIGFYTLAFLVLALVFYFLPSFETAIQQWGRNYAPKSCRKIANMCVREARKHVPYMAEYNIKDNKITYHRVKNDNSKPAWSRKLKGVAIHGRLATVLFRKFTSFSPKMIILHNDYVPIQYVLNSASIESKVMG